MKHQMRKLGLAFTIAALTMTSLTVGAAGRGGGSLVGNGVDGWGQPTPINEDPQQITIIMRYEQDGIAMICYRNSEGIVYCVPESQGISTY